MSPRRPPPRPDAGSASASGRATVAANEPPPGDLVPVGRVAGGYGVHGWLKITPYSPAPDSVLCSATTWWLDGPVPVRWSIEQARVHADSVIARTGAVLTREAALALKGRQLSVSRAAFPPGVADEHYWVDLIGCEVRNPRGAALGRVSGLDDHGAHPLLLVRGDDGVERMIPFVGQYIGQVDAGARVILADWELDY